MVRPVQRVYPSEGSSATVCHKTMSGPPGVSVGLNPFLSLSLHPGTTPICSVPVPPHPSLTFYLSLCVSLPLSLSVSVCVCHTLFRYFCHSLSVLLFVSPCLSFSVFIPVFLSLSGSLSLCVSLKTQKETRSQSNFTIVE